MAAIALALLGCGGAAAVVRDEEARDEPPPRYGIALRFEGADAADGGAPRTRVSLVRIPPEGERTVRELAVEVGACFHEPAGEALIAARCWWAGEGARYEVRREGEVVVALRADVDAEGSAGELAEVARLEVPEDAELDVLAPSGAMPFAGPLAGRRAR